MTPVTECPSQAPDVFWSSSWSPAGTWFPPDGWDQNSVMTCCVTDLLMCFPLRQNKSSIELSEQHPDPDPDPDPLCTFRHQHLPGRLRSHGESQVSWDLVGLQGGWDGQWGGGEEAQALPGLFSSSVFQISVFFFLSPPSFVTLCWFEVRWNFRGKSEEFLKKKNILLLSCDELSGLSCFL